MSSMQATLAAAPSPELMTQVVVSGVVMGCIFALVAIGFNLVFSATGVINFAQGDFLILGGFVFYTATVTLSWSLLPSVGLAVLAVAAMAAFVQFGLLRHSRGEGVIGRDAVTLGVSILIVAISSFIWGVDPLPVQPTTAGGPVEIGWLVVSRQQLWIVGVTTLAVLVLHLFFKKTNAGIAVRATAMNKHAAMGVGVSVDRVALTSWVVAGALGALAGLLVTPLTGVSYAAGFLFTLSGFAAAILGGMGSMLGAVLGGLLLGVMQSLSAAFIAADFRDAAPMIVLLLVFALRPQGILGKLVSRA
ncbi:branched-chain amino acid ABC transporter permease [Streptomyces sp. NPDC050388]|uniref:branched-chain amino acid ABC transporter permease n=1 Tax=Streptomyces sp. NPDC050388 TaxID=3155781 RepID=UPI003417F09C